MRRYEAQGTAVLRSNQSDFRQWFLRKDGYLETIGAAVCVWPTEQIDVARTPTMTIDMSYIDSYVWVTTTRTVPAVNGLSCPILMPGPIIVRNLRVHANP